MPLPNPPRPGMVIRYEYLWKHEDKGGDERGEKRRPCAIIIATHNTETGRIETVVAPITHRPPQEPAEGVLVPSRVRQSIGLDSDDCWVIVTDLNVFDWPGVDLYPIPGQPPGTYLYGYLPPALFDRIRVRIMAQTIKPTQRLNDGRR